MLQSIGSQRVGHNLVIEQQHKSKEQWDAQYKPTRMVTIKETDNKFWWGCKESETLTHCWRDCKVVQPLCENSLLVSQNVKLGVTILSSNSTLKVYAQEN